MGKKNVKNKRKTELRIIFFIILVAAALFIISTYAWFSTQKNVLITNLSGVVEVAEGLEISLDAENWANEIVLGDEVNIIDSAYAGHRNIMPKEMLPVSTLGIPATKTEKDVKMIRGKVTNSIYLTNIVAMDEKLALDPDPTKHDVVNEQYPGYIAFDIFLKNSSKQTDKDDDLQLNYDSVLKIIETGGNDTVGLQNTVRVALAKYGTGETTGANYADGTPIRKGVANAAETNPTTILQKTGAEVDGADAVYISDVTMWEPNSSDHVEYIVINNNKITWSATEGPKYGTLNETTGKYEFNTTTQMPTYALTNDAAGDGKEIKDIYWWDVEKTYKVKGDDVNTYTNSGKLQKQTVLQTTNTKNADGTVDYAIAEGVQNLFSTHNTTTDATKGTVPANFSIAPNSIIRLRVYVWLEGQDIDCINYASYGGGVTINLGLVKGAEVGSKGDDVNVD